MALDFRTVSNPAGVDEVYTQLQQYSFQIGDLLSEARKFHVTDIDGVERAIMIAAEARTLNKRIEDVKKQITAPARDFVSKINDTANSFTEKLDEIESDLLAKIDQWKEEERIRREEAIYFGDAPTVYQADYSSIKTEKATASEKVVYEFEIVDYSQIPTQYLAIDTKKCEHSMKMGMQSIPGIKINKKVTTTLRLK